MIFWTIFNVRFPGSVIEIDDDDDEGDDESENDLNTEVIVHNNYKARYW